MRLTRVFVDAPLASGTELALPPGAAQHLARVLRLGTGDALVVFNGGGGEYAATVQAVRRADMRVRVGAHMAVERESPLHITLLQGIARGEKMDQVLQKATELGVSRVIPVLSARSNVRVDAQGAARKRDHWQSVVIAACEQCGRNRVPVVDAPLSLPQACSTVDAALKLALVPEPGAASLHALLASGDKPPGSVALLVGPEGGLGRDEIRVAGLAGFVPCLLGPRILRTETAAPALLAALQYAAGDFSATP